MCLLQDVFYLLYLDFLCVCCRMCFTCSTDKTVAVWDTEVGERMRKLKGHQSFVNSVCPARRGPQFLCSGSDDGTVKVSVCSGSDDGTVKVSVCSGSDDGTVKVCVCSGS